MVIKIEMEKYRKIHANIEIYIYLSRYLSRKIDGSINKMSIKSNFLVASLYMMRWIY